MKDWEYNIKAMFAGLEHSQALATDLFTEEAINHIETKRELSVIGLSHSLTHNNNATAHLVYDVFDEVYSFNGAQTNYYQLYHADKNFAEELNKRFSISLIDDTAIYNLDPTQSQLTSKSCLFPYQYLFSHKIPTKCSTIRISPIYSIHNKLLSDKSY